MYQQVEKPRKGARITAILFAKLLSCAAIAEVVVWICLFRSANWSGYHVFYLHPLMMISSFAFVAANSVMVWKLLPFRHNTVKAIHFTLNTLVIGGIGVGLAAIIMYVSRLGLPHFNNLHSWIGISTIGFTALQYTVGISAFLSRCCTLPTRQTIAVSHSWFGRIIFISACAAMLTGLQQAETFAQLTHTISFFNAEAVLLKCTALTIWLLLLSVYTVVSGYKTANQLEVENGGTGIKSEPYVLPQPYAEEFTMTQPPSRASYY